MSGAFDALYASVGRPSIPPEMLLRALLLQAFYYQPALIRTYAPSHGGRGT